MPSTTNVSQVVNEHQESMSQQNMVFQNQMPLHTMTSVGDEEQVDQNILMNIVDNTAPSQTIEEDFQNDS